MRSDSTLARRRRRGPLALLTVVGLLVSTLALSVITASAGTVATNSCFEGSDANLVSNGATDWNSFAPVTWGGTAPFQTTTATANGYRMSGFEDRIVSNSDTGFAGGVKQDTQCASVIGSKAPNKDDLSRVYIAAATKAVGSEDHTFLALGWVRIPQNTVSASAHIGYEFNRGSSGACSGSSLVQRTAGDMLVVYNFEGGANAPTINLSRWLTESEPGGPNGPSVPRTTRSRKCREFDAALDAPNTTPGLAITASMRPDAAATSSSASALVRA